MFQCLQRPTWPKWILLALLVALVGGSARPAAAAAQDLEIQTLQKRKKIKSRTTESGAYYKVRDIAQALDLEVRETGSILVIAGPRGNLQLTDGRPLVRFGEQYILIASAVWKRSSGEWYVPEDFLTHAATLLLDQKLQKVDDRRYRVDALRENEVSVEIVNYPDHVSIIFIPRRRMPERVRDLQRLIRVEFDENLVKPRFSGNSPNTNIVSALRFNSDELFGSFDIVKGEKYYSFREYALNDPDRKVIEIYGRPTAGLPVESVDDAKAAAIDPSSNDNLATVPIPNPPAPGLDQTAPEFAPRRIRNAITIDAGHGGEDYGVKPSQEVLEKNFTFQIARQIDSLLRRTRFEGVMTRVRDILVSNEQRSALANHAQSQAFVSMHLGGAPDSETRGPVVYVHRYFSEPTASRGSFIPWEEAQRSFLPRSKKLAEIMQQRLNLVFGTSNQVVEVPLAVLASVEAPAVLVEAGFLTNSQDRERLGDPIFQARIAEAITQALTEFFQ